MDDCRKDRRIYPRYDYQVVIEFEFVLVPGDSEADRAPSLVGLIQNKSLRGMAMMSMNRVAPEQVLAIRFPLGEEGPNVYRVRWSCETETGMWLSGVSRLL